MLFTETTARTPSHLAFASLPLYPLAYRLRSGVFCLMRHGAELAQRRRGRRRADGANINSSRSHDQGYDNSLAIKQTVIKFNEIGSHSGRSRKVSYAVTLRGRPGLRCAVACNGLAAAFVRFRPNP